MDRQIEDARIKAATKSEAELISQADPENKAKPDYNSGHLMCRTALWGIAGFIGCGYFAWISFSRVVHNDYVWPHDAWTATTYIVWILLLGGLAVDTRCMRERFFFGILVINFVIGFALTLWHNVASAEIRNARLATGALWALAAVLSLSTLAGAADLRKNTKAV